jgi:hypothetical protein
MPVYYSVQRPIMLEGYEPVVVLSKAGFAIGETYIFQASQYVHGNSLYSTFWSQLNISAEWKHLQNLPWGSCLDGGEWSSPEGAQCQVALSGYPCEILRAQKCPAPITVYFFPMYTRSLFYFEVVCPIKRMCQKFLIRRRKIALAMAEHPRLGQKSPLSLLSDEILALISKSF